MIVKDKSSWLRMVLDFRGSSLPQTWKRIAGVTLLAVVVTYVYHRAIRKPIRSPRCRSR